jgi:DhnA family fructose-bisphosphate aldolase class Ia
MGFVEDAIVLGADAIAMTISVVGDEQGEMITMLGRLVSDARPLGLPVVAHIYPKGSQSRPEDFFNLQYVRYAARVGVEAGVDIVKVPYSGSPESFAQVVEACPVPLVAAGGPRLESIEELFTMVRGVIDAGARGLTIGRNVWGARHIPATMAALKAIVHEGKSVAEAIEIYQRHSIPADQRL